MINNYGKSARLETLFRIRSMQLVGTNYIIIIHRRKRTYIVYVRKNFNTEHHART